MTDSTSSRALRRRSMTDTALRASVALLVAAVVGGAALLAYTVWTGSRAEQSSTPAQRALKELSEFARENPNNAAARVRYGEALAAAGLLKQAAEQFEAAVKLDENHTGAWLNLGLVAMMLDERTSAERYFQEVIDLTAGQQYEQVNERRERALFHLGEIALDDKRYEEAAGYFKAALRIRRDASTTYYLLGQSLHGMGDDNAALKQLEIAIAFDPNYPEARFLMGEILLSRDDRINAAVHLVKAAELVPDSSQVKEALAELGTADEAVRRSLTALKGGSEVQATDEALLATTLDPNSAPAQLAYAQALVARGEKKAAKEAAKRALELDPRLAEAERLLASLE